MDCPFCDPKDPFFKTNRIFAIWDAYPVSPGHALIIPWRHIPTWDEATASEQRALTSHIELVQLVISGKHKPDGFNVGFNSGTAAGMTIPHLHIHIIPRYIGDVENPRGGIRHVMPGKGDYLKD